MVHTPGRPRKKKAKSTEELLEELEGLLNKLFASVSDSNFENQLTPEQLKNVADHLGYALVAGFEQNVKKKMKDAPRKKLTEVKVSPRTMNRASLAGALGFSFSMDGDHCIIQNRAKVRDVFRIPRGDLFEFLQGYFRHSLEFIVIDQVNKNEILL